MKKRSTSAIADELNAAGFSSKDIGRCVRGELVISDKRRVSASSCFGDCSWSFRIPGNVRHQAVATCAMEVLWTYEDRRRYECLTDSVMVGIKAATLLRILMHGSVRETVSRAKEVLRFLNYAAQLATEANRRIEVLADLEVADLKRAIDRYPFSRRSLDKHAKRLVYFMAEPWVGRYIPGGPVHWRRSDLDTLGWRNYRKEAVKPKSVLPSGLFRDRSDLCRALVHDFLNAVGVKTEDDQFDNQTYGALVNNRQTIIVRYPDFGAAYDCYVALCGERRTRKTKSNHVQYAYSRVGFSVPLEALLDVVRRSRYAAQNLLFQYSGMRGCEGRTLRFNESDDLHERTKGCLLSEHGRHYLVGTVTKGRSLDSIVNVDSWVAIDCVRDAVRLLSKQYDLTNNRSLVSTLWARGNAASQHWCVGNNQYFLLPEFRGTRWESFIRDYDGNLTEYTDRHTLVAELSRLGVGLVAITRQLHHVGAMLQNARISDVATAYGELGLSSSSRVLNTFHDHEKAVATGKREEETERTVGIFREGAKLAGPAAEKIKEEIDTRFAGMGLEGEARERYVRRLSREGFVLPPTVDGFRCAYLSFTQDHHPGCVNGGGCDIECENIIIDEAQIPRVEKEYRGIVRQLHNRAQFLNLASLVHQEAEYAKFLRQLGKEPEAIRREVEAGLSDSGIH